VYAGEPVHVVVADNDTVARFEEVRDALGGDVVIGTVEQLGESFGQARLAITVDVHRRSDLYRRMLTVSNSRVAEHLRSAPVVDRLLRNRMVVVNGDINDEVANQVTAQLVLLDSEDPAVDITMYINSSGGSVVAAFAILDTIELISAPVVTCVVGLAAGTALLLATSGAQGKRHAVPKANLVLVMPESKPTTDPIQLAMFERWTETIMDRIATATGQPVSRVRADAEQKRSFRAFEAVEYGLVDEVVDRSR
ncbi:ClpP family protease, partial [Kibdelosporangium lantanae]